MKNFSQPEKIVIHYYFGNLHQGISASNVVQYAFKALEPLLHK